MIPSSRSAKIAALCFALVAMLVLGGLAWATSVSLRLKTADRQATAQADYNRRLRLALWRIDPLVMNVLAKEASHPYWYYSAYYYSPQAIHTGGEDLTGSVIHPSPLLDHQSTEDWILLHFQLSARTGWSSPQLPSADAWWVGDLDVDSANHAARHTLLTSLASTYDYRNFAGVVTDAESTALAASRWIIGEDRADVVHPGSRGRTLAKQTLTRQQPDGAPRRAQQQMIVREVSRPPQACDPLDVAFSNLHNVISPHSVGQHEQDTSYISVTVSPMTALWVRLPEHHEPLLAMVRTVEAEGDKVYQGFLVDWNELSALLIDTISDLFHDVRLQIIEPGEVHDPETSLASIPIRLVTEPAAVGVVSLRDGLDAHLVFAWIAAIVALTAVGLGVRSLLLMSERRSQFAYAVTHELRTPLTTLCLYTDMLSQGLVREENRESYIDALRDESQRLSDLVSGILEYSRVENQTLRLDTRTVSVGELIDAVRQRCEPRCQKAGMTLVTNANRLDDVAVSTDVQLAVQIIGNLIDNACKYAATGDDPKITLRAELHDHAVGLEIEDTGPGISRRDRRQVLKPFRRGRSAAARKAGGVGLGLALARSWARLLGGRLDLLPPRSGTGARFRLTLPAKGEGRLRTGG